jgi:iron complex outermembrane receptor protein
MRTFFLLVCAFVLGISGFSQEVLNDTVYELPQVQISSERIDDFSTGLKIQKMDSLALELNQDKNLGELLARQSPLYIKSYGQGSLATISFRGTSSAHTGIYWNGFNLNLPNLGSSDLSLIPSSMFNSVEMLYGASGSLFGSGNIGGNIQLRNNPQFNAGTKANLNLSAGSYNSYGLNGTLQFSNDKWWTSTAFTFRNAKNDFPFTNLNGDRETRDNAAVLQYGLMQDVYRKISDKHLIGLSFWYQFTDREIPKTLVTKPTNAFQDDESVRVSGSWKYFLAKGTFVLKSAFLRDDENYTDPDSEIEQNRNSRILTNTFVSEANYQFKVNNRLDFNAGANFSNSVGEATAYMGNPQRTQFGIFGSVLYRIPKINWKINLNLRQDFIESFDVPFTPSLGFEGKIWNFIYGKANFSKNFRAPTFNDLYWEPFGNSELQPETSYNGEFGLLLKNKNKQGTFSSFFSGTLYSSIIDNWILWVPVNNNWSPENIQKVWSRGLELEEKLDFRINKSKFTIVLGYALVKSTNQEKISDNDQSFEKQLIYVPEHSFSGNVDYLFRSFIISFNTSLTGKRYITRDNMEYLPAFIISDLQIVKKFLIKRSTINLSFKINNLWDSEYQAIQYYPMPGRNYKLSLNFKI